MYLVKPTVRKLIQAGVCILVWPVDLAFSSSDCGLKPENPISGEVKNYPADKVSAQQIDCWYGKAIHALDAKQFQKAEAYLLHVTDHAPHYAGAWLDLVMLYDVTGQSTQLNWALNTLEQRFDLPPAIALIVQKYKTKAADQAPDRWPAFADAVLLELELGYGNNLNNGSRHDIIRLAGGDVVLSDQSQPRRGSFFATTLQALWQRRFSEWDLVPWAVLRDVRYNTVSENNQSLAMAGLSASKKLTGSTELRLNSYFLFSERRASEDQTKWWIQSKLSHQLDDGWKASVWASGQTERDMSRSHQLLLGVGAEKVLQGRTFFSSVEIESEEVHGNRNGGDSRTYSFRTGVRGKAWNGRYITQLRYESQTDQRPYSESLFGERRKDLEQWRLELSYSKPVTKNQSVTLWSDYIREDSEIELFETRGWQAGIRWQYSW